MLVCPSKRSPSPIGVPSHTHMTQECAGACWEPASKRARLQATNVGRAFSNAAHPLGIAFAAQPQRQLCATAWPTTQHPQQPPQGQPADAKGSAATRRRASATACTLSLRSMAAADGSEADVEDTATSSGESAGSAVHTAAGDEDSITSGLQRAAPAAFSNSDSGFSFGPRPVTSVDRAWFWADATTK